MTAVIQGNLHGSRLAHDLLLQMATEWGSEILILSEPYTDIDSPTWFVGDSGFAALWIRGDAATKVTQHGKGADHVWAKVADVTYASVYLTPNCSAAEFENKAAALEDAVRDMPGKIVLAGDYNARAIEWEMDWTNRRGKLLLEMAARLGK